MKKAISIMLTGVMFIGMSFHTVAADSIGQGDSDSQAVKATYKAGQEADVVYSVDIAWSDLEFTYQGEEKGTWNPEIHSYENGKEAGWTEKKGTIIVTNHSNTNIKATATYKANEGYSSVNMQFDQNNLTVDTADNGENGEAGTPVVKTIQVTPSGSLPETATTDTTIGQITVAIQ